MSDRRSSWDQGHWVFLFTAPVRITKTDARKASLAPLCEPGIRIRRRSNPMHAWGDNVRAGSVCVEPRHRRIPSVIEEGAQWK